MELDGHAAQLHNQWWIMQRVLAKPPHVGHTPWEDEDEPAKDNDRVLVPRWCQRLALYAKGEEAWQRAFVAMVMNAKLAE